MSKQIAFVLFLVIPGVVLAQRDSARVHHIGMSSFSEGGVYPGFSFNYERRLLSSDKYQLLWGAKAGTYFHYQNHTGVFLMVQSGQRFRIHKRWYFEHFLGVGYLHSFLSGGDAYYVNASGQVQTASNTGNPHFMPSVSFGVSYALPGKQPTIFFLRPMIFWQIPFNETSLVQYAFEVGALFKLKK